MNHLTTALALLSLAGTAWSADIIPATRRIAWDPGIPGGIPNRTTIFTTVANLDPSGVVDARAAIQAAIDSCPADQVVKLPPGTFRINGGLRMKSRVTLRGSGTNATVLKSYGSVDGLIMFGASGVQWDPTAISTAISGANAGAAAIPLASTAGVMAGSYLVITELNDPTYVSIDGTLNGPATWVDGWNTGGARARGQIVEVTSVSGNSVGIKPALYSSFTRTPWATRFTAQCAWAGVEDLKTYSNNTGTSRNILMQCAAYCWTRNIECDYTDGDHAALDWSYRCEISHSYFHDAYVHASGTYDNQVGLRYKSTACLITDNILRRMHVSVMCEWGAAGNVISYNYDEGNFDQQTQTGNRWLPPSMNGNHGAHPQFNLFEGNVSQKFSADAFWGSSSDTTLFRNHFSGTGVAHPPYIGRGIEDTSITAVLIQANRSIDIWELQSNQNVVGNIVGSSALLSRGLVRKVVNPSPRSYDNPPYCFSYGYTSESSSGVTALANPTSTLIEHGNYDVASAGTVWDAAISERTLPVSLYLTTKPAWWGSAPWPAIGPDVAGRVNKIPAQLRYEGNPAVPDDLTPPTIAISAPANGATVSGVVNISATASDNVGVAGVQFTIDGSNVGPADTVAPYSASWDSAGVSNGPHTFAAVARDAAGNTATSVSVTVTISNGAPQPTGQSLFTTEAPTLLRRSDGAGVNYELGMRFRSSQAGRITAIRFWKDSSESGAHTGRLWSAGGALLSSVTFTGETASGWQTQALATPVSIAANTEYLVSVNTGNTYYVATNNGLATAIANGALSSLVGSNGRYGPVGQYPTNSWSASNYFRDVVFVPGSFSSPTQIAQGGFETPAIGSGNYRYNAAGSAWTFEGAAGLTANASGFTGSNPNAPEGAQVAFMQGTGTVQQNISFAAGTYTLSFKAAQRSNWQSSYQVLRMSIDGAPIGDFRPLGGSYQTMSTAAFTVTAGSHVVSITGLNPNGGDNTAFVDGMMLTQSMPTSKS